jgi:hypothetical protein
MAENWQLPDKIQIQNPQSIRRWPYDDTPPELPNDKTVKQNGLISLGFAKGIIVGGVLGTIAAMYFAMRIGMKFGRTVPEADRGTRQLPTSEAEYHDEDLYGTQRHLKVGRIWRVIFSIASGVAMFADSRIKKM